MKTLYLECNMGASGDMLMSALYELCERKEEFLDFMNGLYPDVTVTDETRERCGIKGTHINILIDGREEHEYMEEHHHDHHGHDEHHDHAHSHSHTSLQDVWDKIDSFSIPAEVKDSAKEIYRTIAAAEAAVHGSDMEHIHFHEVGEKDAVCDVLGVCWLIYALAPDRICASPVCTGYGEVRCAHGILPVPAPATEMLLREIPSYAGTVEGELCTPTGAALIGYFSEEYGSRPMMTKKQCGYGMGTKEFEKANCLRAFLGDGIQGENDMVAELSCNIDDMTGEEIGFAAERLRENGALDVFTVPVQMKKNRPGIIITVICNIEDADRMAEDMLRYTSTLGVRRKDCNRYILNRSFEEYELPDGRIRKKCAEGYGIQKSKFEFDDLAAYAKAHGMTIEDIRALIQDESRRNK